MAHGRAKGAQCRRGEGVSLLCSKVLSENRQHTPIRCSNPACEVCKKEQQGAALLAPRAAALQAPPDPKPFRLCVVGAARSSARGWRSAWPCCALTIP